MIQNKKVGWAEDLLLGHSCTTEEMFDETHKNLDTYGSLQPMLHVHKSDEAWVKDYIYKSVIKQEKKPKMNKAIMEAFPKTADAVVVQKHFGHEINNFTKELILLANKDAYLAEANRREAEELKRRENPCR